MLKCVQDVLEALVQPTRRRLLEQLRRGECGVSALTEAVGAAQPAVSKHLRVLREAGLVDVRVDGQRRLYRLRPQGLDPLEDWLTPYRDFWQARLDDLSDHLAAEGSAHTDTEEQT